MNRRSDRTADERVAFIRGAGSFLPDIVSRSGSGEYLYAAFVRSLVSHARVIALEVDEAREAEGVRAVYTAADLGNLSIPSQLRPNMVSVEGMDRPILASSVVRYVGEPVAMVVAESPTAAIDAADLVFADYDESEAVVDPQSARLDRAVLFPEAGTNVVSTWSVGEHDTADDGPISVTIEVVNQRVAAVTLEPLSIAVQPVGARIDVLCGHQMTHRLRADLASVLGLDEADILVQVPDTGGAFGMKGSMYPEYAAVAKAAIILGQGVAWFGRRREDLAGGTHGRDQRHRVTVTGNSDGRLRSLNIELLANLGAYPSAGSFIPSTTLACAQGPYEIPSLRASAIAVVTNTAPVGPYRGAGRPEATYALELAIDEFARAAGLDPIEVRRNNLIQPEQLPYRARTGAVYDGGDYPAAFNELVRLLDIPAVRRRTPIDGRVYGVGTCVFVEPAGGSPQSGEYSKVAIGIDGGVTVWSGSVASGQGHSRVFRRLVSEILGVDPASIEVIVGASDEMPRSVGSFGSRSIQVGATAVYRVALRVEDQARQQASRLLEAATADLELNGDGFSVVGVPDAGISFAEIAADLSSMGSALVADEWYQPGRQTFPYGAYGAIVSVDIETGEVRVERVVAVDDCGLVLDPAGARDQVVGGIAQGLGQALSEWIEYDARGQLLTGSLTDYRIPTAQEMPEIILGSVTTRSDVNDLGSRGLGEAGTIGTPPAIALALADALGFAPPEMPFRPQTIWRSLVRGRQMADE